MLLANIVKYTWGNIGDKTLFYVVQIITNIKFTDDIPVKT